MEHHVRHEYCHNRLQYRDSRLPTAVKVYTIANESRHLLVFGVPKINLHAEVKREFQRYGTVTQTSLVTDQMTQRPAGSSTNSDGGDSSSSSGLTIEQFTDVYRVVFEKLEHSRRAKRFSDAKNFYGGILHVSYAPECESMADWRQKLAQRMREVQYRVRKNAAAANDANDAKGGTQRKRKYDAIRGDYVDVDGSRNRCKQRK